MKLHGVDTKNHSIVSELTRIRQYMDKIQRIENDQKAPSLNLDKAAADRIIKHGLAGNEKYDAERAARQDKEHERAQKKLAALNSVREAKKRKNMGEGVATKLGGNTSVTDTTSSGLVSHENSNTSVARDDAVLDERKHKRQKSHKPPKSSKDVFRALLAASPDSPPQKDISADPRKSE
jgi:exosome complex protein LRP1